MGKLDVSRNLKWLGMALIVLVGVIHFADAPDSFEEAFYKGALFVANGVGALVAAIGISRGAKSWGWTLGALVAAGAFVGYVASRTVGLPGLGVDTWMEPMGILSLVAEGLFVVLYAVVALAPSATSLRSKSVVEDRR